MRIERTHSALLATALALSSAACSGDDENDHAHTATSATKAGGHDDDADSGAKSGLDFSSFDAALNRAIDDYNATSDGQALPIRGASAVVITKDRGLVYSQGYGDFAADRVYLIASSSKILSVGVVMKLADAGKLDIDKPLSDYLGDAWGDHKTQVSFAQLASNSSGLPSLTEISAAGQNLTPENIARFSPHFCQYSPAGTLSDCGRSIYQDDVPDNNRQPDSEFRYGGSQWQLAGALAEQVSGESWADLIRQTYVEPCGAETLGYTNPFGQRSDGTSALTYPADFQGDAAHAPETDNPSIEGGAYITGPDYAKLLLMHLRGGVCGDTQVLSADAVATMQRDRVAAYGGTPSVGGIDEKFTGYGLGWWLKDDYIADPGAYGAYPYLDLERGYGAMILLEVSSAVGGALATQVKPVLDEIIDAAGK